MLKEAYHFENMNGEFAYMLGCLDQAVDFLFNTGKTLNYPNTFDSDLFEIEEDFKENISAIMKERFKLYQKYSDRGESYGKTEKQKELVENFHIELKQLDETDIKKAVYTMYEKNGDKTSEASKTVKDSAEFLERELTSILNSGNPKALYTCDLSAKAHDTMHMFYNWGINDVLFIEYEGYLVLLTFGWDD